jgi:hypothetical protein
VTFSHRALIARWALLWTCAGVAVATGQTRIGAPAPGQAFARFRPVAEPLWHFPTPALRQYPATYYFEGAVIGAGLLGATGALIAYEWGCHYSDSQSDCRAGPVIGVGLGGALFGGTVGAIVGGLFPAPHPRPLRGKPSKAALLGASAGALLGFGLLSQFCLNGCHSGEVEFNVSMTAIGALAGFIVGH